MARTENLYTPNCVRTVSGRYVNLLQPDPETLDIGDIAHALSMMPRFGGHLPIHYSVAHHSVQVCSMLSRLNRWEQFQGLMHDASEAYLMDLPQPLKLLLPEYKVIEDRMMWALADRFGFVWPLSSNVKAADKRALEDEWAQLMLAAGDRVVMTRVGADLSVKGLFLEEYERLKP